MDFSACKAKLKINNEQILQNSRAPPWELKKQKAREESLGLELQYFYDMFSTNQSFSKSLVEISNDLNIRKHFAMSLMCLLDYRENLILRTQKPHQKSTNIYICTSKGKTLIDAISKWKSKGIKIPEHLKPAFELLNGKIKFNQG